MPWGCLVPCYNVAALVRAECVARGARAVLLSSVREALMNERCVRVRVHGVGRCVRPLLVGLLLSVGTAAQAEERGSRRVGWEPRVPVGKCLTSAGGLLVNERPGQPWQSLDEEDDLHSRDLLLALPGMKAKLVTQPRAVELTLWGNLPGLTEFS